MVEFTKELDASGLNCPLPILKAKKVLNTMQLGEVLHVLTTDPGSVKDFDAFARQTGNKLLSSTEENGKYSFLIEKAK
ncbi:putative redox protein, regulator of disulfide bond formation [Beggiatoa alba B18LD]|uniref:Putative redox protein, regulator of disulfide bond formation n=1 Tax=Beggiatoa alba B18LD TaxID=395493 RepID=I3CIZ9_9GAMM|nr:sulfurtransferase TusA family protein [Beggiatoa alba]EIJ43592.1 putative redox protein, regulator of disulfide bond formation [Beggiatoa alba B18LD]